MSTASDIVTEVKQRKIVGILRDDRIATFTTNGFTEGCHAKIKMLKRVFYGLKNMEVYWRKMLLGFVPSRSCFHTTLTKSPTLLNSLEYGDIMDNKAYAFGGEIKIGER